MLFRERQKDWSRGCLSPVFSEKKELRKLAKIPVVVGVTGHRDYLPEEREKLADLVRKELRAIRERCPHSPMMLLTSLAEGADQLAAEAALSEGYALSVPCPMPVPEFEKDFTADVLRNFRTLLTKADEVFCVPLGSPENIADPSDFSDPEARNHAYRTAGIYVAEHCHVMLALWDGNPGKAMGCGTAEAVDFKLNSVRDEPDLRSLQAPEGFVIQIETRRKSREADFAESGRIRRFGDQKELREILRETERFNRDAERDAASRKAVLAAESAGGMLGRIAAVYDAADRMSVQNAKKHRLTIGLISTAAALFTISFLLYDEMSLYRLILLCGILIGVLFLISLVARRSEFHERYIEYRMLAEGLRVQQFLLRSGVSESVGGQLSWAVQTRLPWVKEAFFALTIGDAAMENDHSATAFCEDQRLYHEKALQRTRKQLRRNDRIMKTALILTLLSYIGALFFEITWGGLLGGEPVLSANTLEMLRTVLKIILGSLSAATLFAGSYYGKMSLDELLSDHERMIRLFETGEHELERVGESPALLLRLAREMLNEHARFYACQSQNRPDVSL